MIDDNKMSITQRMRAVLKPSGTSPTVQLNLYEKFFHVEFVNSCIDELDKMTTLAALGEKPSNLEKLAYYVLCDSAHIETDKEKINE